MADGDGDGATRFEVTLISKVSSFWLGSFPGLARCSLAFARCPLAVARHGPARDPFSVLLPFFFPLSAGSEEATAQRLALRAPDSKEFWRHEGRHAVRCVCRLTGGGGHGRSPRAAGVKGN